MFTYFALSLFCRNLSWRSRRELLSLPAWRHALRRKTWWWTRLQPTLCLPWSLSRLRLHSPHRVLSSRLLLLCHPSSLSLSLLVQQTPSSHPGQSVFPLLSLTFFFLQLRNTQESLRVALWIFLPSSSFTLPPPPVFDFESQSEPSEPSPPKSPRRSPPRTSPTVAPPAPASPLEAKHDVPYFRWEPLFCLSCDLTTVTLQSLVQF